MPSLIPLDDNSQRSLTGGMPKPMKRLVPIQDSTAPITQPPLAAPPATAPAKKLGKQKRVSWLGESNLPVVGKLDDRDVIEFPAPTKDKPGNRILLLPAPRWSPTGTPEVVESDGKGGYVKRGLFLPSQVKQGDAPQGGQQSAAPAASDILRNRETLEKWKGIRPQEVAAIELDLQRAEKFAANSEPDLALTFQQSAAERYKKLQAELGGYDQFVSQQRQVEQGIATPPMALYTDPRRQQPQDTLVGTDTAGAMAGELGGQAMMEQMAQADDAAARQAYQSQFVSNNAGSRIADAFDTGVEGVATGLARMLPGTGDSELLSEMTRNQQSFSAANAAAGGGIERTLQGAAQSVGVMAPGIAATALTGGTAAAPYLMAGAAGASSYGQAYQEATDAGLRGSDREKYALTSAAAEAGMSLLFTKALKLPGIEGIFTKAGITGANYRQIFGSALRSIGRSGAEEIPEEVATAVVQNVAARLSGVDPNRPVLSGQELVDIVAQSFIAAGGMRAVADAGDVRRELSRAGVVQRNAKAFIDTPSGPADWAKSHAENATEIAAAVREGKPITRSMMEDNMLPVMDAGKRAEWARKVAEAIDAEKANRERAAQEDVFGQLQAIDDDVFVENAVRGPQPQEPQAATPTQQPQQQDPLPTMRAEQAAKVRELGAEYEDLARSIERGEQDDALQYDMQLDEAGVDSPEQSFNRGIAPQPTAEQAAPQEAARPIGVGDVVLDTREGRLGGRVVSVDEQKGVAVIKRGEGKKAVRSIVPLRALQVEKPMPQPKSLKNRGRGAQPQQTQPQQPVNPSAADLRNPRRGGVGVGGVAPQSDYPGGFMPQSESTQEQPANAQQPPAEPARAAQPEAEVSPAQQAEAGNAQPEVTQPPRSLKQPAARTAPRLSRGQQMAAVQKAFPGARVAAAPNSTGRYTITLPNGKFITAEYVPAIDVSPAAKASLRASLEANRGRPVSDEELESAQILGSWRVSDGQGFETDGQGLVRILDSLDPETATAKAVHESVHSLVGMGLMSQAEFDALAKRFAPNAKTRSEAEEAIAYAVERGAANEKRTIVQRLRDLLSQFLSAITGDRWKPSAQTALKRLKSGAMLRREGKTETRREAAARLSAGVDERYSADMENPQTETPEFKRWFGDSKVVDAEGKPLVVYHGSRSKYIDKFDIGMEGTGAVNSARKRFGAIWFTSSKDNAHFFADSVDDSLADSESIFVYGDGPYYASVDSVNGDNLFQVGPYKTHSDAEDSAALAVSRYNKDPDRGSAVFPLYLSIKNPLVLDGVIPREKEFDKARAEGRDGIIANNVSDGSTHGDVYVAFDALQIKSATGNAGTFDPDNPDIRYSAEPTPAPDYYRDLPDTAAQKSSYEKAASLGNYGTTQAARDELDRMRISDTENVEQAARNFSEVRAAGERMVAADPQAVEAMIESGRVLNAEETAAAFLYIDRMIQEGMAKDDADLRRRAHKLQFRLRYDSRAETARALALGRDAMETPFQRNQRLVQENVLGIPPTIAEAVRQAFDYAKELERGGDKEAARRALRKANRMQGDAIRVAEKNIEFMKKNGILPKDDAGWREVYGNNRLASRMVREAIARNASWYAKAMEWWSSAGLLSGPVTHARNLLGTPLNYGFRSIPTRLLTDLALVGTGQKGAMQAAGEWGAFFKAAWPGFKNGLRHMADSFIQEVGTFDESLGRTGYTEGLLETAGGKYSISGLKGKAVRAIGWGPLRAADQFWKAWIGNMEAARAAYEIAKRNNPQASPEALRAHIAELMADTRSEAWKRAMQVADEATFTEDGSTIRSQGKTLAKALRKSAAGRVTMLPFIVPFIDTPVNMAAQQMSYTPVLGLVNMAVQAYDKLNNPKKAMRVSQLELAMRQVVGGAYYMVAAYMLGMFDDEDDEGKKKPYVVHGGDHPTHPYTIQIGDKYLAYLGIEPAGTSLAMMADFHNRVIKSGASWDRKAMRSFRSMVDQLAARPMLNGVNDVLEIFASSKQRDPETADRETLRGIMNWSKNFAASWSPSLWRQTRQAMSKTQVSTKLTPDDTEGEAAYRTFGKRVVEQAGMQDIPEYLGWKSPAAVKYDIFGNAKTPVMFKDSPASDFFYRLAFPLRTTQDAAHPGSEMIAAYNNSLDRDVKPYMQQEFTASYTTEDGKRRAFTEQQAEQFYKYAGRVNQLVFEKMKYDPKATGDSLKAQIEDFKTQVSEVGEVARKEMERLVNGDISELPSPEEIAEKVARTRKKSLVNAARRPIDKRQKGETDREAAERVKKATEKKSLARLSRDRLNQ